ncbi:MAG TPA: hypothetical protein VHE34_01015 [Puia sp.]|uniref:hypothetical protein n=1 Tax=Puia sp. TaxID=2045100 RepID=UPI002BB21F93|nr:hypothetical protein [Puia sp.]HVU93764.1 hypothetical protein [Puia sp.]
MCKLGLVLLFSLITGSNYAQGYFVLLQSGNRQPFYVRLGTQLYSSTPGGHLILSQLKDSTYTMAIGRTGRPGVEQSYALTPSRKDQEFEIRDRGEAGWDLYDTQTKEWLTAVSRSGGREEVRAIGVRRDDAFSRMMADVVHDTAVLYNDYAGSELAVTPAIRPGTAGTAPTGTAAGEIPATNTPATGTSAADTPSTRPSSADSPATSTASAGTPTPRIPPAGTPNAGISTAGTASAGLPPPGNPVTSTATAGTPANAAPGNKPDTATAPISRIDTPVIRPETVGSPATRPGNSATLQPKSDPSAIPAGSNTAKADSPAANSFRSGPPLETDSSARRALYLPIPSVVKLSERKLTRNMRLVYADKGKDAKSDTVVVIIPLDTPQTAAAKRRNTNLDSSRPAAKQRNSNPDSSRNATKPHNAFPDSSHPATKPHNANPDSSRPAAAKIRNTSPADSGRSSSGRSRNAGPDSTRTAATRLRTADSGRVTSARLKGSTLDSPSGVREIVPTPITPAAEKSRPNDSSKKPAAKSPLPYVNSDCHAFATDYDIDKLRVKMLEVAKDEERIAAALKVFKAKCFYTRQIKALSEVFTTDASKYRFFETAYPFAADEHFRELGGLLTDPIYQSKFKTLTGVH